MRSPTVCSSHVGEVGSPPHKTGNRRQRSWAQGFPTHCPPHMFLLPLKISKQLVWSGLGQDIKLYFVSIHPSKAALELRAIPCEGNSSLESDYRASVATTSPAAAASYLLCRSTVLIKVTLPLRYVLLGRISQRGFHQVFLSSSNFCNPYDP